MKTSSVFLLILGLAIETAGFIADRTEVFSFAVPLIAPDYTSGMQGVAILESTKIDPLTINHSHCRRFVSW